MRPDNMATDMVLCLCRTDRYADGECLFSNPLLSILFIAMKVSTRVTFDTSKEEHAAVIAWLDEQDNRAEAVRAACVAYVGGRVGESDLLSTLQGIQNTVAFLEREIVGVRSHIQSNPSVVMREGSDDGGNIPQDVLANFDNVGV